MVHQRFGSLKGETDPHRVFFIDFSFLPHDLAARVAQDFMVR
jgi:hypothetical protein